MRERKPGQGSRWIAPALRWAIYVRDGLARVYCGRTYATVLLSLDHLHPRCLGGTADPRNLVTACHDCNSARKHLTLRDFIVRRCGARDTIVADFIRRTVQKPLDRKVGAVLAAEAARRRKGETPDRGEAVRGEG